MGSPPPFFSPPMSPVPASVAEAEVVFSAATGAGAGAKVELAETLAKEAMPLPLAAVVVGVEDGVITAFLVGEGEDPGGKTVFKPIEGAGVGFDSGLGIFSDLGLEALGASTIALALVTAPEGAKAWRYLASSMEASK
eukprot:CAMPEP_0196573508 /NCGR_PEP_ID=MMETSP1081-20130531/3402_1 /TAXON_ID=36882 /ORGANISM="Pyramimonas amylifera, Strain CCMP720" /LENGTH=137 /DNA_ID=CAMNT_0041891245 /DNA_START=429 /DNA_END=839 /DNA_ORIENTATION=+